MKSYRANAYSKLHVWIAENKPKPEDCERCHKKKKLDLSSNDHKYTGDIKDWEWICRSCHKKKDHLIKNKKYDPNDSKRKNINVATLKKVEDFLKEQKKPVFKSGIVKSAGVDYDSLNMALGMLKIKKDKEGRIKIC